MKPEIVYDGKIKEKRLGIVRKYSDLLVKVPYVSDTELADKQHIVDDIMKLYMDWAVFLDVKLGGFIYDVVVVGDFGYAISPYRESDVFAPTARLYKLSELNRLKVPIFAHPKKTYMSRIQPEPIGLYECVSDALELDYAKFTQTQLWAQLVDLRKRIATETGMSVSDVFTKDAVFTMLNTFPDALVPGCMIPEDIQWRIIDVWRHYGGTYYMCD